MRKFILTLVAFPLMACANNSNTIPEIAYRSQTETTTNTAPIDHKQWNDLVQKHVAASGNVDYKGFKKDQALLQSYLNLLAKNLPEKSWTKNAVLAYWINTYNAYTVKLILDNYPVKSIKDIKDPWGKKFFTLGTKKYSLEEIEHEILRKMGEPRIHFAINCASFSCPNLLNEAFTETKLQKQLEATAKAFVNDKAKNTITADKVEISKIFDWFSVDFIEKNSKIFNAKDSRFYSLPLTKKHLDENIENINWKELSRNSNIDWSFEFFQSNFDKFNLYYLKQNKSIYDLLSKEEIISFLENE